MNFDDIQKTWRSPHNQPSAAQLENDKMKFVTDLRRRRRGNIFFLALIFSLLAFFTGKLVLHILFPEPGLDTVDLSREWGVIPFFMLPWVGWFFLVRLHWRQHVQHPRYDRSISATVSALLDESRAARTRTKFNAGLLLASVVVLPLVVHQLRAVGKSGDEILIPAFVIYPTYVALTIIWAIVHDRRKLRPRERELEAILATYGEEGGR